jgi:HK97 family phage major capsid protein
MIDEFTSAEQLRTRRPELVEKIQRAHALAGAEPLEGKSKDAFNAWNEEVDEIDDALNQRQIREERLRDIARRPENRIGGTPPDPRVHRGDPVGDALSPEASVTRSAGLRANDAASYLPENVREHMENQIRQDDDPDQRLARLVAALADRNYFRAFSAVFRDPISGGHEWSPAERDAVLKVKTLQRALGFGSQGGTYLVPYELDPAILISNAGAISSLRQIARVVTTALNEKRFVTSAGVTSNWVPETTEATDDSPPWSSPRSPARRARPTCRSPSSCSTTATSPSRSGRCSPTLGQCRRRSGSR